MARLEEDVRGGLLVVVKVGVDGEVGGECLRLFLGGGIFCTKRSHHSVRNRSFTFSCG